MSTLTSADRKDQLKAAAEQYKSYVASGREAPRSLRLAAMQYELWLREERERQENQHGGLLEFIRYFWHVLEPVDPFVEGWPLECLCAHLEAITRSETVEINGVERPFNRFLANVPPGFMKSLCVNVFWPAWEWGPQKLSHLRYVAFSYNSDLTERDNAKFRDLICSAVYREMWGHVFNVLGDGKVVVSNDKTGFKRATSFGGTGTGERGHRVLLDDPHKIKGTQESDEARASVTNWVEEGMQNRLNDLMRDAIVIIMQRVHENDTAGIVQTKLGDEYCSLILPMEYEGNRHFSHYTGWNDGQDPREYDGELAWEARYPAAAIASFKRNNYLWAGQYQQNPVPRGGGLFQDEWWQAHEVVRKESGGYLFKPEVNPIFVLASLDTAYSEKEENDYSALTVWVVHDNVITKQRNILMVDAWQKRLPNLSGPRVDPLPGEHPSAHRRRAMAKWGLAEWVADTCIRKRVHTLIVENKNRAPDVIKEIKKLFSDRDWGVRALDIKGDKWGRANAITDIFTDEMVFAPAEITEDGDVRWLDWAQEALTQISRFPRGGHDDILDSMTMAMKYLRDNGYAIRKDERAGDERARATHRGGARQPIYPV